MAYTVTDIFNFVDGGQIEETDNNSKSCLHTLLSHDEAVITAELHTLPEVKSV